MKKSIAILMLTLCLALLCACGETAEPAPETPAPDAQEAAAQTLPEEAPDAQPEAPAQEPEEAAEQADDAPAQEPEEAPKEPSALETALTFVDQDAAALVLASESRWKRSMRRPAPDPAMTASGPMTALRSIPIGKMASRPLSTRNKRKRK